VNAAKATRLGRKLASAARNGGDRLATCPSMAVHKAVEHHNQAASHLRLAADYSANAAEHYSHGAHEQAAHYALLAHAHMQHAGQFMSDAAKIHAELHGGNKHTVIG
jgi:hypothetical protein